MRSWRDLAWLACLTACGDDGGGPCLVPVAVGDRLRLGSDCRVMSLYDPLPCVDGGTTGHAARVTVRADGVELRTWIEFVVGSTVEGGEQRVVGDLLGTGRCEPRRELARAASVEGYRVEVTSTGFEVVVEDWFQTVAQVTAPDGSILMTLPLAESPCGGPLHGVAIARPDGTTHESGPLLATRLGLELARAPDGIRVAATVGIEHPALLWGSSCQSPVFLTLGPDGDVIAAESPVAVPPF